MLTSIGWLSAMGWQVYLAGICFMVGSVIQGLIALNNPDYVYQSWHGTLLTIAIIVFSIAFNTILAVRLPLLEGIVLVIHIFGLFAIIVPLWVLAPRGTAKDVLLTFTDNGNWGNTGLASMIGVVTPIGLLIGYDCSVHLCKFISTAQAMNIVAYTNESQRKKSTTLLGSCPKQLCTQSSSTR